MGSTKPSNAERKFLSFRDYSIQRRLPLFICVLLATVIIAFSWMSYQGIKKAAVESGSLRLQSLSGQLSTLFGQSAQGLIAATRNVANHESVKRFIQSGGKDSADAVSTLAEGLQRDSTWVLVEITDNKGNPISQYSKTGLKAPSSAEEVLGLDSGKPDTGKVGRIYVSENHMYYPLNAAVMNGNQVSGYIIRWRRMQTTQEAVNRFSMLLGDGVTLYVGNVDGSLWTDMNKPVLSELPQPGSGAATKEYSRDGGKYFASIASVNSTKWAVMTEQSESKVTAAASKFLKSAISTGLIIIIVGSFITWLISRSITRPLKKLTSAAAAIAGGDYNEKVAVYSRDETGQLARSFNIMAEEVRHSQQNLEQKVQQRTSQLEESNNELEAFSYSVSHDLRAPLRAISGYAMILKEDHSKTFDPEANRVLNNIISNASMMGRLIDDLISFSKVNKRETLYHQVDMKIMAEICFRELKQQEKSNCRLEIEDLPSCYGDGSLLKQVWLNLIGNAIKYSSKKPDPVVNISYTREENKIIYIIRDNGAGFDMKYAHKLFGVFQRLHKYDEYPGTGIGLALVKRILNKQGGEIWAEAELDKGAVFSFSMPVQQEEAVVKQNGSPQNTYHG